MTTTYRPMSPVDTPSVSRIGITPLRPGDVAMVAEHAGEVVGAAVARYNAVHPMDLLLAVAVDETSRRRGIGRELVMRLRDVTTLPLTSKGVPGTDWHGFMTGCGAEVYQRCPPATVHSSHQDVRAWVERHRRGDLVNGTDLSHATRTDIWVSLYALTHADWAPAADHAVLARRFAPLMRDTLLPADSWFAFRDGRPVAGGFTFAAGGDRREAACESLRPEHPAAAADVAACMAAIVGSAAGKPVHFDGHVTDPHFHPVLRGIPGVTGDRWDLFVLR